MKTDYMVIKKEIYNCITRGHNWLFSLAIHSGHWEEVRSTSLVGLCLEFREPINSPWLNRIKDWLVKQQRSIGEEEDMASWGEEIWDSSMALICLRHLGFSQKRPEYQKVLRWIMSLYNKNNHCNWHDEPWETSWALLAIMETEPNQELFRITYDATRWILSLQDDDGKIISPQYTAYFILIISKLMNYNLKLSDEEKRKFFAALCNAKEYLLNNISEDVLWTGEAWSNGQILFALSSTRNFPYNNKTLLQKVVNWFIVNQDEESGNWGDVEDTASAILGLYHLLKQLEESDGFDECDLRRKLNDYLKTPTLCLKRKFIEHYDDGYTSINLSPTIKRTITILLALASGLTAVIALWDYIAVLWGYVTKLFGW